MICTRRTRSLATTTLQRLPKNYPTPTFGLLEESTLWAGIIRSAARLDEEFGDLQLPSARITSFFPTNQPTHPKG